MYICCMKKWICLIIVSLMSCSQPPENNYWNGDTIRKDGLILYPSPLGSDTIYKETDSLGNIDLILRRKL
jgi:hypothetical protein